MNVALLIPLLGVSIPIIAILANTVFKPWLKLKERQLELTSAAAAEKAAQYAAQTERLEQRVRVLERIVTDRGQDLAGEIDRLRDFQATPPLGFQADDRLPTQREVSR